MSCGSSEAYITVFKPAHPDKPTEGPHIWNDQLLQYAAYGDGDKVIGDPKNVSHLQHPHVSFFEQATFKHQADTKMLHSLLQLRFTEMLSERFGWDGPRDGKKGAYDYLPLVVQADPNGPPELFELPLNCAPPVQIHHPRYPGESITPLD